MKGKKEGVNNNQKWLNNSLGSKCSVTNGYDENMTDIMTLWWNYRLRFFVLLLVIKGVHM